MHNAAAISIFPESFEVQDTTCVFSNSTEAVLIHASQLVQKLEPSQCVLISSCTSANKCAVSADNLTVSLTFDEILNAGAMFSEFKVELAKMSPWACTEDAVPRYDDASYTTGIATVRVFPWYIPQVPKDMNACAYIL
jgi:hypothetical protein